MWKVIHNKLFKKLKFDYTTKSYLYKPEFIPENETHKVVWDLGIQTDHLILARRLELVTKKRKKKRKMKKDILYNGFCRHSGPLSKIKESEKRDKYLDLATELRKLCNWCA